MKLTNKLIAGFTAMSLVVAAFGPALTSLTVKADNAENMLAYEWAFDAGLTTMTSFSAFMPASAVTREAAARFLVKGAEALGATPTSDQTCDYSDLADADQTLTEFVNEGCEMGIFKAQDMFNPKSIMTRSQAELTIARTIYGMEEVSSYASDNGITEFAAARELLMADEVVQVEVPGDSAVQRLHLILMLYRLADMDVVDPTDPTDPTEPVIVKKGSLDVSLSSMTPAAAEVPAASSGLPVAKFEFSAGSSDVTVSSVKLLRKGFSDTNTLEGVALVADTGRVSKARDENSTDGTVDLTLNNGGYVVKANTTVVFTVVATVGNSVAAANDTFGFQVSTVTSSAESTNVTSAISPLMRVSSQDAPEVDFEANGSSSAVKMGQTAAELAKFKITNNNSDQTVTIKSLTFEEVGTVDENTELKNFALFIDNVQFGSTVASTMNKYVTFSNAAGKVINTNNNVKLVIKADVVGGAGKTVRFELDNALDLVADGSKFGPGVGIVGVAPIQSASNVNIDAGEITLDDVDAVSDKMREDKDDVVLGKIKVTNVAGKALELQQFGVKATLTPGTATTVGPVALTLANLFENFELYNESNGATYELDLAGNVYSDADLNIAIAQGTTTFAIRADTKKDITNFQTASVKLDLTAGAIGANGGLYIIETEDDTAVTDITPSSLTWKTMKGTEAGATVALTPLANISKVRGSSEVVALQFTVEADESSALMIDEAKVYVTAAGVAATNQQIAKVSLYKGTVDAANLLDDVSGSQLAAGVATFNGFDTSIAADATQAYVVTVSIVDGANSVAGSPLRVALDNDASTINTNTALSVEDDDNDTVTASYPATTSNRNIAVTNAGSLTVTADTNNVDNKDPKTILAGTSTKVFSVDVQASNENVDVEEVVFTTADDLTNAVTTATLYLGDTAIATNTNADITPTTITFKNLTNLIIAQSTQELRLELNTATIGFEKVGNVLTNSTIDGVAFNEVEGVDSGKPVTVLPLVASSQDFSIVPVKVTASVTQALSVSNSQAKLTITIDKGSNTVDASNAAPQALLTDLVFSELGNNTLGYKIYKEGNAANFGTIDNAGAFTAGAMPTNDLTISTSATYVIVPVGTVDETYSLVLAKDGVVYDVAGVNLATGLTSNSVNDVELGSRTY